MHLKCSVVHVDRSQVVQTAHLSFVLTSFNNTLLDIENTGIWVCIGVKEVDMKQLFWTTGKISSELFVEREQGPSL